MFRKELTYYFSSPIAYIVIGLYLLAVSLFLWVLPGGWNVVDAGYADLRGLFELSPWLLMLLCPALTMRLISEERQSGTWDLLCCQATPIWRLVLGKYLAAWVLTLVAIVPCIVHFVVVFFMAEPMGNIDSGQFFGSLIGLVLLSGTFTGLGLLAGSFSKSQIVSFLLGAVVCFVLYWTVLQARCDSLGRGVIDLRDVVLLPAIAATCVVLTTFIVSRKK